MHQASAGTVLREWGRHRLHRVRRPADAHRAAARPVRRRAAAGSTTRDFEDAIAACNLLPGPGLDAAGDLLRLARPRAARRARRRARRSSCPGLLADPRARGALPRRLAARLRARGAAAGAGAAVAAVAVHAGPGLVPRAAARARRRGRVRWVVYLVLGGARGRDDRAVARARAARLRRGRARAGGGRGGAAPVRRCGVTLAAARRGRRRPAASAPSPGSRSRSARSPTAAAS